MLETANCKIYLHFSFFEIVILNRLVESDKRLFEVSNCKLILQFMNGVNRLKK